MITVTDKEVQMMREKDQRRRLEASRKNELAYRRLKILVDEASRKPVAVDSYKTTATAIARELRAMGFTIKGSWMDLGKNMDPEQYGSAESFTKVIGWIEAEIESVDRMMEGG